MNQAASAPKEQFIGFYALQPFYLTAAEYEEVLREVTAHVLAGDVTLADRILARMLHESAPRYHQIKQAELLQAQPIP